MRNRVCLVLASFAAAASVAPAHAAVTVSLEAPGVQTSSTAPAALVTFEGPNPAGITTTGFGTSGANQYGGAGGVGTYGSTDRTGTISIALASAVSNFGVWVSALDGGNGIEFFNNGTLIGGFNLSNAFFGAGGNNSYNGNPNATFAGQNSGQQYAFFNFASDTPFNSVNLYGGNGGTLEVDNISIGIAAVPEPATWAMMLVGFGAVGGAARYRRRKTNVAFA